MNLPKAYKPYKKRTCQLRIDGVIRGIFTASRPKFHRVQCKHEDPFSARRLAPIPMTALYVWRHYWSVHAHKFAAPWVLSFGCYRRKKVYLLNVWRPIVPVLFCWLHPGKCRLVCMGVLYKRSKFQLNRRRNSWVIRSQNIRHSIPTLDCKFEPNLTFTDRDETGARRKVWTKDSLGPSAQKFLSPHFRVMAPENWYLAIFDP